MYIDFTIDKKMIVDTFEEYTVELHTSFTPQFVNYVINLCSVYANSGKEKCENYSAPRLRANFDSNRFELGFCIVKRYDDVVVTFGIDKLNDWAVLARYLRHVNTTDFRPVAYGVVFPFLERHLKVAGICFTQNLDKRDFFGAGARRFSKQIGNSPIHARAAHQVSKIKSVDGVVLYRGVEQHAFYIPYGEGAPPFQAANTSFNRSAA